MQSENEQTGGYGRTAPSPAPQPQSGYTIEKRHRDWMVIDPQGELVCLTVYKRGAVEVVRRLAA